MHLFDVDTQDTMRAGVIQNFEVAYEQCWKMLQRWIKVNRTPEDAVNPRTRKDLFRMVARYGLIADPLPWFSKYPPAKPGALSVNRSKRLAQILGRLKAAS